MFLSIEKRMVNFIDDVVDNSDAAAITTAIIVMGHSLNMHIIAEGVETRQQLDFLHSNNCYHVQGYLFSRPLPAEEVTALLLEQAVGQT
ncbi:MAG: EAL domain-containing protein [Gammaproteobacteria bacterium]|nr:EAL domain-containing protein [Gammaproteobacteria bacterium]